MSELARDDREWTLESDPRNRELARAKEEHRTIFEAYVKEKALAGELREALRPFADIEIYRDDGSPISVCVPVANIEAARKAVSTSDV